MSSLMEDDDDQQFADLLAGFEEDPTGDDTIECEQPEPMECDTDQPIPIGAPTEQDDTDWDAVMQAAEAAEQEEEPPQHQQRPSSSPTQITQTAPFSQQPMSQHSERSRTFADCFDAESFPFASQRSVSNAPVKDLTSSLRNASSNSQRSQTIPKLSAPLTATPASFNTSRPLSKNVTSKRDINFGEAPAPTPSKYAAPVYVNEPNADLRDPISGFKITNRLISSVTLKEKLAGSKVMSIADTIRKAANAPRRTVDATQVAAGSAGAFGIAGNWVVFGVLIHKSPPRATSTGKGKYCIWKISDLNGSHASVFLFGKAFETYWQLNEGCVLALANPEDSRSFGGGGGAPNKFGGQPAEAPLLALSIKFSGQALHLGQCADFAFCKSYRNEQGSHGSVKSMVKCKNVVNLSKSEYCEYHVKGAYKALLNKRSDLNQSRDARPPTLFGAPAVLPAKSAPKGAGGAKGQGSAGAGGHGGALADKMRAAAEKAAKLRSVGRLGTMANAKATPEQKQELQKQQDKKDLESARKWDQLSNNTTASSRFVQRVVATHAGQSSSIIAEKNAGLMATAQRIKTEMVTGVPQPRLAPQAPLKQRVVEKAPIDPSVLKETFTYKARNPLAAPAHAPVKPERPASAAASSSTKVSASAMKAPMASTSSGVQTARPGTGLAGVLASFSQTTSTGATRPIASNQATVTAAMQPPPARPQTAAPGITSSMLTSKSSSANTTSSSYMNSSASVPSLTQIPPPSSSFAQSFGSAPSTAPLGAPLGSGLIPMLGRGWIGQSQQAQSTQGRPANMNAGERAKINARAQQEATATALRSAGLLGKPDPNATTASAAVRLPLQPTSVGSIRVNGVAIPVSGVKRKSMEPAPVKTTYVIQANGAVTRDTPMTASEELINPDSDPSEARATAKRQKLAAAFGQSGSAEAMEKILNQTSAHADLVHQSEASIQADEAMYNMMEKKEALAKQLNDITQQSVRAYRCMHEGCTQPVSEFPLGACRLKGHRIERVDVQKRFFICQQCKFHLSTLNNKLPTHVCHKCGCTVWLKAAMIPMKIDSSDRDQLQLRSEETFLRSTY